MKGLFLALIIPIGLVLGLMGAYVVFKPHLPADLLPVVNDADEPAELPLSKLSIERLAESEIKPAELQLGEVLEENAAYRAYQFTYQSDGKSISGRITYPISVLRKGEVNLSTPIVVMLRGFVPAANYVNGAGTNPAARAFATQGFVTVAPDFLGYGQSDAEYEDPWEGRFRKPLQVAELVRGVQANGVPIPTVDVENEVVGNLAETALEEVQQSVDSSASGAIDSTELSLSQEVVEESDKLVDGEQSTVRDNRPVYIWAHSNGGQIALTALEILGEAIPTTLWAPVTAPFPYSILYFGDEEEDEGLEQRQWISLFDLDYDARDFSFTQHLNRLAGLPLQIHQGLQDEAIHYIWNDEFEEKITAENERRVEVIEQLNNSTPTASESASETVDKSLTVDSPFLQPIDLNYYRYPTANHNMQPDWQTVVNRDDEFIREQLTTMP